MAASENLIDFDIIENQKENIQALPGGRSARALASMFSPSPLHKLATPTPLDTKNLNDMARQEFETEIENISESDDPLDVYDRYMRWTLEAYPSAQATPGSQLLPLLERATKTFLNSTQYKNDPRYLKLWISYIRFFSDTPRETFAFLSHHNIGDGLALFYEEFAAWLEGAERWTQAEEVYQLGIEREARPTARLARKFAEFQQRFERRPENVNGPSSPALPTVRPALGLKVDPFAAPAPRDPQAPRPNPGIGGSTTTKSGGRKLAIFSDADDAAPAVSANETSGWQNIGSLANRKKENVMEPKPMAGETLKAGGKKSSTKIAVFKDEFSLPRYEYPQITNPAEQQVTMNQKGRMERIAVSLEAIYQSPEIIGSELSLEELRAASKGWLSKAWVSEAPTNQGSNENVLELEEQLDEVKPLVQKIEKLLIARDPPSIPSDEVKSAAQKMEKLVIARDPATVPFDENGVPIKDTNREGRSRKMKIKEVNETQIIKAKLESPSGKKMTKRKSSKEPTMTLHTKAATDEIYDLFSQPLPIEEEQEEEEESTDDDDEMTDGDYTSGGESTTTGRLPSTSEAGDYEDDEHFDETSEVKSVSEWSEFTAQKHIPRINDDERNEGSDENDDTRASRFTAADDTFDAIKVGTSHENTDEEEELVTPISPELPSNPRTMYVPIPPEDYEPAMRPYRDPSQISQNRLPFMTPIAEKTESSLGLPTAQKPNDYFSSKTPSKGKGVKQLPLVEVGSSPFREIINEALPVNRIAQPQLGKNQKATKPAPLTVKAPLAKEIANKGPIIKDAQCNPVDDYTRNLILENLQPPLSSYDGFFEHKNKAGGRSAEIKKFAKAMAKITKNASERTSTNLSMPPNLCFPGTSREYIVKRELGAGAFAPVYLLENVAQEDEDDDDSTAVMGRGAFSSTHRRDLEALKMEDPPSAWEFYIMRQAKRRFGGCRAAESIIDVHELHLYSDECYLIEEFRDQGTLLDVINFARSDATAAGPGVMDESLVMFFTIELFRTIETLHSKGLLHGDLKADNCLVRLDQLGDSEVWSSKYRRDGTSGWSKKGIALIDFGRGIDMKAFLPDVQFIADWKTGPQDCAEMRELRPWTYQIDYHGLAGIIHSMLFGKYIDTVADKGAGIGATAKKSWRIRENLKRYWQVEIWGGVFDLLLNPAMHVEGEEGGKLPVLKSMKNVREQMETWLEGNSEKGVGLQMGIRKLEAGLTRKK